MRKWNGWGDESGSFPVAAGLRAYLAEAIGPGNALPDATLEAVLATVGASRLPPHPLIDTDREARVRHACGQSLPDWLAMRSGRFEAFPDGVAFPENDADVRAVLAYARSHDLVVIPYGGGTSVVGHVTPVPGERPVLTVAMSRMNRLRRLDPESQLASFDAGTPGPLVEAQLKAHGFTLGHFPQSFEFSTVGGWVASRSSGQQSPRYGRIEQLFAGGTLETFAGRLAISAFPASSTGPDLREIVLGSEGRFGILTAAQLRVSRLPEREEFHVAFLPDWPSAVTAMRHLVQARLPLSMVRLSNAEETRSLLTLAGHRKGLALLETYAALRGAGAGKCMLTLGVTGSDAAVSFGLRQARRLLKSYRAVFTGRRLGGRWAATRFRSPYLREPLWRMGYAVDTLETAGDWPGIPALTAAIESALSGGLAESGERVLVFSHLSHVYPQGSSLYTTYLFRCADSYETTLSRWQRLKRAASDAVVAHGGTISHHHGVGRDHAPWLAHEKGELGMRMLGSLAHHFDPGCQLNPGKLLPYD